MPENPYSDRTAPDPERPVPDLGSPPVRRDRGLRTARRLTGALVASAAALVLGLGVLAAGGTVPGTEAAAAAPTTTGGTTTTTDPATGTDSSTATDPATDASAATDATAPVTSGAS